MSINRKYRSPLKKDEIVLKQFRPFPRNIEVSLEGIKIHREVWLIFIIEGNTNKNMCKFFT